MHSKILVGVAVALVALGLGALPVAADDEESSHPFQCSATLTGGTINGNVRVPANAVCVLNGVTVDGSVSAGSDAYFESAGSTISGNVSGNGALTLYVRGASRVAGSITAHGTPQVFVYDSTIGQSIRATNSVAPGYGHFQVCGSTIGRGISVTGMGPDVLIGAPAAGCGANTIKHGGIVVSRNATDQELYVISNSVPSGDIVVSNNTGVGDKQVHANNAPTGDLVCRGNSTPFSGTGNGTVGSAEGGQCAAVTLTKKEGESNDSLDRSPDS